MAKPISEIEIQRRFGAQMRRIRLEKKLTQETVAERSDLHPNYIGSVERGERNISICNIAQIAFALEISLSELMAVDLPLAADNRKETA